ncbi:S8 family peptidase [Aquimarina sp. 433]
MKKSIVTLKLICLSLLGIWGCSVDEESMIESAELNKAYEKSNSYNSVIPDIMKDQVVVKFTNPNLNEVDKKLLRLQIEQSYDFKILNKEVCDCDPEGPELWTIDTTYSNFPGIKHLVENLVTNHENNSGDEEVEVDPRAIFDYQFYIDIADKTLSGNYSSILENKIIPATNSDYVNIAIVDTGIDYDYFDSPILYSTRNIFNNRFGISGWDYVNHDNDMRDDNGHGTMVAKIINSELTSNNIPHQLLSVKAFDQEGRGSYYDIVCSLNYLSKLNNIDIVNMSFGWYGLKNQKILKQIIKLMESNVLFITSAGNLGVNVDEEIPHFPSGYAIENLLGVAGYELDAPEEVQMPDILDFISINSSNYGSETIDIAAPIDGYFYIMNTESNLSINPIGTSFSAAYITASAGKLYDKEITSLELHQDVLRGAYNIYRLENHIHQGRVVIRE